MERFIYLSRSFGKFISARTAYLNFPLAFRYFQMLFAFGAYINFVSRTSLRSFARKLRRISEHKSHLIKICHKKVIFFMSLIKVCGENSVYCKGYDNQTYQIKCKASRKCGYISCDQIYNRQKCRQAVKSVSAVHKLL